MALVTERRAFGDDRVRYRTAEGKTYERTGSRFLGPERTIGVNLTGAAEPDFLKLANLSDLTYEGRGTRGNVTGHVYVASGVDSLRKGVLEAENISRDRLKGYELVVVVSSEGVVRYLQFSLTLQSDTGRVRNVETLRYTGVGDTDVSPPEWLSKAKRAAKEPGPNDLVTRKFEGQGPDGRVEVYVTAKKSSLQTGGAALGPTLSENPMYRNDLLDRVRAGEIFRIYWLSAERVQKVRVVFHYEDADLPRDNESTLRVVYDDREEYLFQRLNSTVDPEANTVSATITDPDRLEELQGNAMLVVDYLAYVEALKDRGE